MGSPNQPRCGVPYVTHSIVYTPPLPQGFTACLLAMLRSASTGTSHTMSISNFMSLPTELHELIISHLDFPSIAHLKHTSHYFNILVKDIDIYEAENSDYARLHGLWACQECASLRPSSELSDKNKRGKRAKSGSEAYKRFCLTCGIKTRPCGRSLYGPGDRIIIRGKLHFVCTLCSQLTKRPNDAQTALCGECVAQILRKKSAIRTGSSGVVETFDRPLNQPSYCDVQERIRTARLEANALKENILRKKSEIEAAGRQAKLERHLKQASPGIT